MANLKKPKCKQCKFWEYTKTLGSPVVPVLHCRSGFTPCAYCGKQVPNDKLVKHRIIFQGLENGKRKIKEQVMNFCSGECAMNEQCSREG